MLKRRVFSLRLKTLTESQARMSYGRSFQFITAECLKQRDDETGNVPDERLYFKPGRTGVCMHPETQRFVTVVS